MKPVKKVNIIFSVGLGLVVLLGIVTNYTTQRLADDVGWVRHTNEVLQELNTTLLLLQKSGPAVERPHYVEGFLRNSAEVSSQIGHLLQLTRDNPEQNARLRSLQSLLAEKNPANNRQIHELFMRVLQEERNLLNVRFEKARLGEGWTVSLLDAGRVVSLLLIVAAVFMLNLSINRKSDEVSAARERMERLQSIVTSIGNAVVAADETGKIIFFNPAAESILGIGAAEGPHSEWSSHYGAFMLDKVTPLPIENFSLLKGLKGVETNDAEYFVRNKNRPQGVFVSVNGRPILGEDGRILGSVSVLTDITKKREAEEALQSLNSSLQEKNGELSSLNKELESFSYAVSHDLRAPLRSIIGFSDILLRKHTGTLDPEALDLLQRIKNSGDRLGQLIDGLLELSRLTRGELRKTSVDLSKIVKECGAELNRAHPGKKVELIVAENVKALADERLLRPVLQNLLENAWKFTSKKDEPRVEFGTEVHMGRTTYFVKDNGAGFNMQYASKLFNIFQRLHSAKEFDGNGIGLATVQRIVTRHGGQIWAEGAPQKGASFYFTI